MSVNPALMNALARLQKMAKRPHFLYGITGSNSIGWKVIACYGYPDKILRRGIKTHDEAMRILRILRNERDGK